MRRILIVDSDTQVSTILAWKLQQLEYEVRTIESTINALSLVKDFKPSLIISEMILPELSGVDFLKRLKLNPDSSTIPFIFLSSTRSVEDKILAHEMGAEAFFVKPIFLKVLIRRIEDFFEQKEFDQILTGNIYNNKFEGKLINITLIDLLNIIHENTKSGTISITAKNQRKGTISFNDDTIVHVEVEGIANQTGEELLLSMLSWVDGVFLISYHDIDIEPNIDTPLNRLIIECTRWLQEYNTNLGELPPLDTKIYLDFGKLIENFSRIPDSAGSVVKHIPELGILLGDLIALTKGDRKSITAYIKQLFNIGIIQKTPVETPLTLPPPPEWLATMVEEKKMLKEKTVAIVGKNSEENGEKEPAPRPMQLEPALDTTETDHMQPHLMTLERANSDGEISSETSQKESDQTAHEKNGEFTAEDLHELFPEKSNKKTSIIIALTLTAIAVGVIIFMK